jgi:ribonuclease-3
VIRRLLDWLTPTKEHIDPALAQQLSGVEAIIGYHFRRKPLLIGALKHRSALQESGEDRHHSNERLEFLGDAVLDFVVAEYFYQEFPLMVEGELTKLRSVICSGSVLSRAAAKLDLGKFVILSTNEERTGGRDRVSILEDAFEALIGAIYLDGGMEPAQIFVETHLLDNWREVVRQKEFINYKSLILEHAQAKQWSAPVYALREETGPDHSKSFVVELLINGVTYGRGEGRSKKSAEQEAALVTAELLGLIPGTDPEQERLGR